MMMKGYPSIYLLAAVFAAACLSASSADAADSLAVRVIQASNYSSASEVRFVLDEKETCDSKNGEDCLFSSDCSEPVHGICVVSKLEIGTHKIEAIANGHHYFAWADVKDLGHGMAAAQCGLEQEEDGAFLLSCI